MDNANNIFFPNLADVTEMGYNTLLQLLRSTVKEMEESPRKDDQAIRTVIDKLNNIIDKGSEQKVLLALLGEMSSGKTSLINAALGYPLFPVAKVTTSACPAEICYAKKFELQVFSITQEQENTIYTFDNAKTLSPEKRQALLNYVQKCVTSKILVCENFDYYFDIRKGQADLENTLHCAQLLIALLNGYVGQDYEEVSELRKKLIKEREQLFLDILGIPADTSIGIRIKVDSSILKHGLTLVDLPGLGSDTATHTDITTNYINKADCCVMLFGLDGNASDNRSALELMQNYEMMRFPGKSSRFILAINKCDDPYEKDLYYSDAIEQAVQSVYDTLHSIEIHEIIPISARYAEYRYVLNGIPPENTTIGKILARNGSSPEQILQSLQKNYSLSFEYTDPRTGADISYSTQKFFEETIGEYSTRIRHLNLLTALSAVTEVFQEALSSLRMETKMIAMLEVLGSSLMGDLMSRMETALKQTHSQFLEQIEKIKADMNKSRLDLADILKNSVLPAYERGLSDADKHLNIYMDKKLSKMQADWADHYCIDGLDEKSKANKAIFNELKNYFSTFNFNPYLKSGDSLLKDYLNDQRNSYNDGVERLAGCFRKLPAQTSEALDDVFEEFIKSVHLKNEKSVNNRDEVIADEIIDIYRKCFNDAREAITAHLSRLADNMIKEIKADKRINNEIKKSISDIFSFFTDLITIYHTSCARYLDSATASTLIFSRPYLNVEGIRKQISIPFSEEEKRKEYVGGLNADLIGQGPDSHNSRIENAQNAAFTAFEENASRSIKAILPIVSYNISSQFDSGSGVIRLRYNRIEDNILLLKRALGRIESSGPVNLTVENDYSWAKESAVAARENIIQTHTLIENDLREAEARNLSSSSTSLSLDK